MELDNLTKKINKLIEMKLISLIDESEFIKKKSEYKQREVDLTKVIDIFRKRMMK